MLRVLIMAIYDRQSDREPHQEGLPIRRAIPLTLTDDERITLERGAPETPASRPRGLARQDCTAGGGWPQKHGHHGGAAHRPGVCGPLAYALCDTSAGWHRA
ncbi:MAG: hypothetical protein R3B74_00445 [Nitrospirales bacterium]|nr:hypothetical protein [Nitrospirales bacterium]